MGKRGRGECTVTLIPSHTHTKCAHAERKKKEKHRIASVLTDQHLVAHNHRDHICEDTVACDVRAPTRLRIACQKSGVSSHRRKQASLLHYLHMRWCGCVRRGQRSTFGNTNARHVIGASCRHTLLPASLTLRRTPPDAPSSEEAMKSREGAMKVR